jgi:ankyrin repeat protein
LGILWRNYLLRDQCNISNINPNIRDHAGQTSLDLAIKNNCAIGALCVLKMGADAGPGRPKKLAKLNGTESTGREAVILALETRVLKELLVSRNLPEAECERLLAMTPDPLAPSSDSSGLTLMPDTAAGDAISSIKKREAEWEQGQAAIAADELELQILIQGGSRQYQFYTSDYDVLYAAALLSPQNRWRLEAGLKCLLKR